MGTGTEDFVDLAHQLNDVQQHDGVRYSTFRVHGQPFGYLWLPTRTVGLRQLVAEQLALVAERPEVFEVQFTSGAFGWVVVNLEGVDRTELAELTYEAWRLTAPVEVVRARGDRLPK